MDTTSKLHPGQPFATATFKQLDGGEVAFGSYLSEIEQRGEGLAALGLSVAAVAVDSEAQTRITAEALPPPPRASRSSPRTRGPC